MQEQQNPQEPFEVALSKLMDVDAELISVAIASMREHGYETFSPASGRTWQPSPAAIMNARRSVTLTDIPLSIARYVVVKAEQKRAPSSAEWLRWLFEDEKKAKEHHDREERDKRAARSWHAVAD